MAVDRTQVAQLLSSSPYRIMTGASPSKADPVSFFKGVAATYADLREGWGISRRIVVGTSVMDCPEFADRLNKEKGGKIFVLEAATGEGKTTFLRQLALQLESRCQVLEWHRFGGHDAGLIRDLCTLPKQYTSGPEPLLIVAELPAGLPADIVWNMCAQIAKDPLPCPLLIAGAAPELRMLNIVGAQRIYFYGLDHESVRVIDELLSQFRRLLVICEQSGLPVDVDLPNLRSFVDQPTAEIFYDSSFFISMLKATQGAEFRSRLISEYRNLQREDQNAGLLYRYICQAHAVSSGLPYRFASQFALHDVDAMVQRFGGGRPWIVCEEDAETLLGARNALIARIVFEELIIEGGDISATTRDFFEKCYIAAQQETPDSVFIRKALIGYAKWQPLTERIRKESRGKIRSELRRFVEQKSAWTSRVREAIRESHSWGQAVSWASLYYHLLPGGWRQDDRLLQENRQWLATAKESHPLHTWPTITYFELKNDLMIAEVKSTIADIRPQILERFEGMVGTVGLGADFYFDFAIHASNQAHNDPTAFRRWSTDAAIAAEYFFSLAGRVDTISSILRALLQLAYAKPTPDEFIYIAKKAWEQSVTLDFVDPQTGSWLAQVLIREGELDYAEAVLKKILAHVFWGDALLLLATGIPQDLALEEFVTEYVQLNLPIAENPLNVALGWHAAAVIARARGNAPDEVRCLTEACGQYEVNSATHLSTMWSVHGDDQWKEAAKRLRELDSVRGSVAVRKWKDAEGRALTARQKPR